MNRYKIIVQETMGEEVILEFQFVDEFRTSTFFGMTLKPMACASVLDILYKENGLLKVFFHLGRG